MCWRRARTASSRSIRRRCRSASSIQPRASASAASACASRRWAASTGRCVLSVRKLGQCSQTLAQGQAPCTGARRQRSRLIPGVNDSGRRFFSITTKISRRDPRPCPHEYHPPIVYTPRSTRCSPPVTTWRPPWSRWRGSVPSCCCRPRWRRRSPASSAGTASPDRPWSSPWSGSSRCADRSRRPRCWPRGRSGPGRGSRCPPPPPRPATAAGPRAAPPAPGRSPGRHRWRTPGRSRRVDDRWVILVRTRAWVPSRDLGSDREEPTPAVIYTGEETLTDVSRKAVSWRLQRRTTLTLDDLAKEVNPVLRGWLTYFTAFYSTAVIPLCKRMDRHLMRWARRKYKRLERSEKRTRAWLRGVRQRSPDLFAHWALRYTT